MYRLPLLNMCSRETYRLPAVQIVALLGCGASLPVDLSQSVPLIMPTGKYFVYWLAQGEFKAKTDAFVLVEVNSFVETILDLGMASAITCRGEGYQYFRGYCEKLKQKFVFYCPLDPSKRGRLKSLSTL